MRTKERSFSKWSYAHMKKLSEAQKDSWFHAVNTKLLFTHFYTELRVWQQN